MAIRPLQNRIVIQQESVKQPAGSLIAIPDMVKDKPTQGKVIAVGPGKYEKGVLVPTVVKVGDVVIFPKGTGAPLKVDGQDYITMFEEDILAIVG